MYGGLKKSGIAKIFFFYLVTILFLWAVEMFIWRGRKAKPSCGLLLKLLSFYKIHLQIKSGLCCSDTSIFDDYNSPGTFCRVCGKLALSVANVSCKWCFRIVLGMTYFYVQLETSYSDFLNSLRPLRLHVFAHETTTDNVLPRNKHILIFRKKWNIYSRYMFIPMKQLFI